MCMCTWEGMCACVGGRDVCMCRWEGCVHV